MQAVEEVVVEVAIIKTIQLLLLVGSMVALVVKTLISSDTTLEKFQCM